jgi:hypothetical protein
MEHELQKAIKLYLLGKKNENKEESKKLLLSSLYKLRQLKNNFTDIKTEFLINKTEIECENILNKIENIFKIINIGDIDKIKKMENICFKEINDKGNTILHHCIDTGDIYILKELLKKGAKIDQVNGHGNTLLEYACLKKDPNIINFLLNHGAKMDKHLYFRKNNKKYLNICDIDSAILVKVIIEKNINNDNSLFLFLGNYFSWNQLVGFDKYTIRDLSIGLTNIFRNSDCYYDYTKIIIEELENFKCKNIKNGLSKLDVILFNLIPFINYPFNVSNSSILKNELKFIIKKYINNNEVLVENIFNIYINNNLFKEDYIGILIFQLINKFKNIKK